MACCLHGRQDFGRLLDWFWLTVYCDCYVRTHERAINASRTIVFDERREPITISIDLRGETEAFLGASMDAQFTSLTDVFFDDDGTTYHRISGYKSRFFGHLGANPVPPKSV